LNSAVFKFAHVFSSLYKRVRDVFFFIKIIEKPRVICQQEKEKEDAGQPAGQPNPEKQLVGLGTGPRSVR